MRERVQLFVISCTIALQAPLSMEFSMQEYWSGLPFPTPWGLPDPGFELASLASDALLGRLFTSVPPGMPLIAMKCGIFLDIGQEVGRHFISYHLACGEQL